MLIEKISHTLHQTYPKYQERLITYADSQGNGRMSVIDGVLSRDPTGEFTGVDYCIFTSATLESALSNTLPTKNIFYGIHLSGGNSQPSSYKLQHTVLLVLPFDEQPFIADLTYKQKNFRSTTPFAVFPKSEMDRWYPNFKVTENLNPGDLTTITMSTKYDNTLQLLFFELTSILTDHLRPIIQELD